MVRERETPGCLAAMPELPAPQQVNILLTGKVLTPQQIQVGMQSCVCGMCVYVCIYACSTCQCFVHSQGADATADPGWYVNVCMWHVCVRVHIPMRVQFVDILFTKCYATACPGRFVHLCMSVT